MQEAVPTIEAESSAPRALERDDAVERTPLREYLESFLVTIILALFGTSFVVQAFKIPSQSMEPTLLIGDHLLVNKFIFGGSGTWYDKLLPYRKSGAATLSFSSFPLTIIRTTSSA